MRASLNARFHAEIQGPDCIQTGSSRLSVETSCNVIGGTEARRLWIYHDRTPQGFKETVTQTVQSLLSFILLIE
jgi:hypothetical protein